MIDYIRDGQEIYRNSFAIIRQEARLERIPADLEKLAVRVIHACGMVEVVDALRFSPGAGKAGRDALAAGAPILCDARMVAEGITRARLPANNEVICTLKDDSVPDLARELGNTRSAVALELWRPYLEGSVVVIGNAPHRLVLPVGNDRCRGAQARADPGVPGGLCRCCRVQGHARRRQPWRAVCDRRRPPWRQRHGRSGGQRPGHGGGVMQARGRLLGLGVGPGDPELITVKALRLLREAPVVAYFVAKGKRGNAFGIIEAHLQDAQTLLPLVYPVTTEALPAPLSYEQVISDFYDQASLDVAAHLDAGRDVAVICEGDPFFYGSYMYLHDRLAERYDAQVVPGVCSMLGWRLCVGCTAGVSQPEPVGSLGRGCHTKNSSAAWPMPMLQ